MESMKESIKKVVSLLLAFLCALSAFSADLKITHTDLMIVPEYQCRPCPLRSIH
jgi:hypothetical protein